MTPPVVDPLTMYIRMTRVKTITGMIMIVPAAVSCPHLEAYCPIRPCTEMGAACVESMKPFPSDLVEGEALTYFATLRILSPVDAPFAVKKAIIEEADKILSLLKQISEFHVIDEESFFSGIINRSSRKYFVEEYGKVVSTASTSAETQDMAMIVGVATAKEFRKRGYASAMLSRMCADLLSEGKTPCLFYENPDAGRIYHRLGFRQIGTWKMLRFQQPRSQ